jgi:hypothetical protein
MQAGFGGRFGAFVSGFRIGFRKWRPWLAETGSISAFNAIADGII